MSYSPIISLLLGGIFCFHSSICQYIPPALHAESVAFMHKENVPGLAVGFIRGSDSGMAVLGYRDLARKLKVEPHTFFGLGEVSQVFTLTLMMKQELAGQIDLYRPLSEQLPPHITVPVFSRTVCEYQQKNEVVYPEEYPGIPLWGGLSCGKVIDTPYVPITYCRLATHYAGLCMDEGTKGKWVLTKKFKPHKRNKVAISSEALLARFSNQCLCSKPGTEFRYANWGIAVLGQLLSGNGTQSFEQVMREEVFEPMNMQNTHYKLEEAEWKNLAQGYSARGKKAEVVFWEGMAPAIGVYTSPRDMMNFLRFSTQNPSSILSHAVQNTQASVGAVYPNSKEWEGLENAYGWWIQEDSEKGYRRVWAEGRGSGYSAYIGFIEDKDIGVFLLANRSVLLRGLGEKMLEVLFTDSEKKFMSKR